MQTRVTSYYEVNRSGLSSYRRPKFDKQLSKLKPKVLTASKAQVVPNKKRSQNQSECFQIRWFKTQGRFDNLMAALKRRLTRSFSLFERIISVVDCRTRW